LSVYTLNPFIQAAKRWTGEETTTEFEAFIADEMLYSGCTVSISGTDLVLTGYPPFSPSGSHLPLGYWLVGPKVWSGKRDNPGSPNYEMVTDTLFQAKYTSV